MSCLKLDEFKEEDTLTYTTSYSRLSCQTVCSLQVQLAAITTTHSPQPSVISRAELVTLSLSLSPIESCSEICLFLSQFLKLCCFPIRWMVSMWQHSESQNKFGPWKTVMRICLFTINKHQRQSIVKNMLSFLGSF